MNIKADRKWEGVKRPNFHLNIKAGKKLRGVINYYVRPTVKKVGNFFTNLSQFTRKSSQPLKLLILHPDPQFHVGISIETK